MAANINDVAKAANVSKATVSRYLNDKSRVSGTTAETIGRVIAELNYVPSAAARNLALRQRDNIGVLISGVVSPYWNQVLGSIHNYVSHNSEPYEIFTLNCDSIILYNTNKSIQDKIHLLVEQRVAGIILALRDLQREDVDFLCSQDIPFVMVQGNLEDERVSCVNIDNYRASYEAAQHLLHLGHKRIAYVSGPSDAFYANERFEGFRDALSSKKLYRRHMILQGENSQSDGYWRMKQILSWSPMPTAVMFGSDSMAYGAMTAVREAGLSIPGDISIVGFDGLAEEVEMFNLLPPLTSVLQPMGQIGEKAAEIILKKVRDKAGGKNRLYRATVPTSFLDRGSCRAI